MLRRGVAEIMDTAAPIARVRAAESDLPVEDRLFEDPYAHLFWGGAAADEAMERFLVAPFFREHVRLRTRFIDDCVRPALADGLHQIVVLGAGFDCRALRLREIAAAGATVYEIDFASQLDAKRATLTAAGVALPDHVRFVPCDFSAPDYEARLSADLQAAGLDTSRRQLFLCEGVLGYLTDAELARTLRWIVETGGAGSRAVFNFPLLRFDAERFAQHVTAAGFAQRDIERLDAVYRRYLRGTPPAGGELYFVAVASI